MKAIISNRLKFEKLDIQGEKHYNFIRKKENNLEKLLSPCMKKVVLLKVNILKFSVQDENQEFSKEKLKNKPVQDNCPSFRPILSAIGTPPYAKFLVPFLKPLTENEYTVRNSFSFAR